MLHLLGRGQLGRELLIRDGVMHRCVAGLRVPQHQAQLVSLIFSVIPTTVPPAWIYWTKGLVVGWPAIIGILAGLWVGTDFGARMANGVGKSLLRRMMVGFVAMMALYMTRR